MLFFWEVGVCMLNEKGMILLESLFLFMIVCVITSLLLVCITSYHKAVEVDKRKALKEELYDVFEKR